MLGSVWRLYLPTMTARRRCDGNGSKQRRCRNVGKRTGASTQKFDCMRMWFHMFLLRVWDGSGDRQRTLVLCLAFHFGARWVGSLVAFPGDASMSEMRGNLEGFLLAAFCIEMFQLCCFSCERAGCFGRSIMCMGDLCPDIACSTQLH